LRRKLSQLAVQNINPPAHGRIEIWDALLPGFGLRVSAAGGRSYFVMCRTGTGATRRQRRIKIGNAGLMDLAEARAKARDLLRRVDEGEDLAPRDETPDLFRAFVLDYLARRRPNLRAGTYREYERLLLRNAVPRWDDMRVGEIKQRHVADLLDDMVRRDAAVSANRLFAVLQHVFKHAVTRGLIAASPIASLDKPTRETSRERFLSDEELRWFWSACEQVGWPFGYIFRLQTLTAQRGGQLRSMEWGEISLPARTWTISGAKMKNKRPHIIHLSDPAADLLREINATAGKTAALKDAELVFTMDGKHALSGFSKAKRRIDRLMAQQAGRAIPNWTLHDLRRTCVNGLAQMGFSPHVCDKVLSHTQGTIAGVAAVYNRYEYLEERKAALCAWARRIETIIRRDTNVLPLPVGARAG
jgi:integrase